MIPRRSPDSTIWLTLGADFSMLELLHFWVVLPVFLGLLVRHLAQLLFVGMAGLPLGFNLMIRSVFDFSYLRDMFVNLLVQFVLFFPNLPLLALRFLSLGALLLLEERNLVPQTTRRKVSLEVGPNEDFIISGESLAAHKVLSIVAVDGVCRRIGNVGKQYW